MGPSPKLSPQPTSATTTREINVARPHKHLSSIFKKKAIVKVTSNYLEHQHKIDTLMSKAVELQHQLGRQPFEAELVEYFSEEELVIIQLYLLWLFPSLNFVEVMA